MSQISWLGSPTAKLQIGERIEFTAPPSRGRPHWFSLLTPQHYGANRGEYKRYLPIQAIGSHHLPLKS